jgi:hypothetical protein
MREAITGALGGMERDQAYSSWRGSWVGRHLRCHQGFDHFGGDSVRDTPIHGADRAQAGGRADDNFAFSAMDHRQPDGPMLCTLGGVVLPLLPHGGRRRSPVGRYHSQTPDAILPIFRSARAGHSAEAGARSPQDPVMFIGMPLTDAR